MVKTSIVSPCLKECAHRRSAPSLVPSFGVRLDRSIEVSLYATRVTPHGISRQSNLIFRNFEHVQTRSGIRNQIDKFQPIIAIEWNSALWPDQLVIYFFGTGDTVVAGVRIEDYWRAKYDVGV